MWILASAVFFFLDKIRRKNVRIARCKPLSSTLWSKQGCCFAHSHKPRYRHHERSTSYQWVKSLDLTEKPIVQEHCPRSPVLRFMAMCVCVCACVQS